MRISGGVLRGKRIACPPGPIRPAMDRMRESLFSILGAIDDLSFLDLFSGSGLVGTEAWSRCARPVVLIEKDRGKRSVILSNIEELVPRPVLRIEPAERFVQRNKTPFDIVNLDPPFDYPHKEDILRRIAGSKCVVPGSIVLIHAPTSEALPETVTGKGASYAFETYDRRDYGASRVTFYRCRCGGGLRARSMTELPEPATIPRS